MMIKESILPGDITILKVFLPSNKMRKKLIKL